MVNLLFTEMLKLKRSTMFLISIIGAAVAPMMVVIVPYIQKPSPPVTFDELFYHTNLYNILVIGVPLYAVIAAYLFNREYAEDTLKNLLTIPVSRVNFMMSKLFVLLMWIMVLTYIAWVLTLCLGWLGQFDGLTSSLIGKSLLQFFLGGALIFLLSSPIILITLVMKNYVPPIIFAIVVTLVNVMAGNSEHRDLFPWSAAGDIANGTLQPTYPPEYSYIGIVLVSIIGFIATFIYFRKVDIH